MIIQKAWTIIKAIYIVAYSILYYYMNNKNDFKMISNYGWMWTIITESI